MRTPYTYADGEWGTLAQEWRRSLEADNKSTNTIRIYLHAVRLLGDWANARDEEHGPLEIPTSELRVYMAELIDRSSAGNAHNNFRCLRTFFNWLVDEEELDRSPMDRMKPPQVEEVPVPIITYDQCATLLETCKGKTFADRRDTAIIRVLFDTGGRRAEVSYLGLDEIDLDINAVRVHGKGRRDRTIPIGAKTAQAVSRYLRARSRHPQSALPALWLGSTGQGALTHAGVKAMLIRRGHEAGIGHIHPHMFRHSLAHYWQSEGGNQDDLMRIMGWKSREMLGRYGASAAVERAHATARALRIGDRV
ncbi:tyrosine-type recombinase/integrase [Actinokineospora sp.]|uniref:tyrosine-type recombinase/integrase n=1 Tax=Actinokineospora sp. TaxID=1872133 RepID=UPI003D6B7FCA